jgi:hypothetical protein
MFSIRWFEPNRRGAFDHYDIIVSGRITCTRPGRPRVYADYRPRGEKKFDGIFVLRTNTDLNPPKRHALLQAVYKPCEQPSTCQLLARDHCRSGESLTETEIEHDCKRFIVRSAPRFAASLAVRGPH